MVIAEGVRTSPVSWYGIMSPRLGIFAILLSKPIPSLLPVMADGLQVPEGTAGKL